MMKILITTGRDMTRSGALEHALKLVRKARERRWDVCVGIPAEHTPEDYRRDVLATGATVIELDMEDFNSHSKWAHVRSAAKMALVLKRYPVDAVVTASPYTEWGIPMLLAAASLGVPLIHVLTLAGVVRITPGKLRLLAWARSRRQKYVTVSQFSNGCVAESFQMPREEIVTICNGAPNVSQPLAVERVETRQLLARELGIPESAPWLLTVAGLRHQKGHELQIMAMSHLLRARPDLKFLWAGTGDLQESMEKLAIAYGVRHAIHFLGRRNDVHKLLMASDLFLFSSLYEGLPLAVLEAMALGLPVVASDCTSLPELIESGKHGLLFRSGNPCDLVDKVIWALAHPQEMAVMADAACERVRTQFTEETMTGKTLDLALSLVSGPLNC
jgi:glycosyltransferase involved in cell wall biosynthesis